MRNVVLALAVACVLDGRCAEAHDEAEAARMAARIQALERENALLEKRLHWHDLVDSANMPKEGTIVHRVRLDGSKDPEESNHLRDIRLPDEASKEEVRMYVASVLKAAMDHRRGHGADDPEVALLTKVGADNVDILVEALAYGPFRSPGFYIVHALSPLVSERHKRLILDHLEAADDLVEIVTDKGWAADAAPTLLRVLAQRSPYLSVDWIEAAAKVAKPEQYEDLKFHLASNSNSLSIWLAMRNLPGLEPLDAWIETSWRSGARRVGSWAHRQFAAVAAHYGHMDAMEVLVKHLPDRQRSEWIAFQELTGFGADRRDPRKEAEAQAWFAANKGNLQFNRALRRYEVKP